MTTMTTARPASIEVLAIRPYTGAGSVKAFVDVRLGGVTIKGAKIIAQPGQRPWLGMPAIKTDRAWLNTVELAPDLRRRVTEIAISAWKADRQQELAEAFDRRGRPADAEDL